MIEDILTTLFQIIASAGFHENLHSSRPDWITRLFELSSFRHSDGKFLRYLILLILFVDWHQNRKVERTAVLVGITSIIWLIITLTYLYWDSPIGLGTQLDQMMANFQAT